MKQLLTILILVCYSIASFGVSINYFYCCGKLKSATIITKEKSNTCKKKCCKNCCKYKQVKLQLKADQKSTAQSQYSFDSVFYDDVIHHYTTTNNVQHFIVLQKEYYQLPLPKVFPDRNILFCVYRI